MIMACVTPDPQDRRTHIYVSFQGGAWAFVGRDRVHRESMTTDHTSASTVEQDAQLKLERYLAMLRRDRTNSALYRTCVDMALAQKRFDVVLTLAKQRLVDEPTDSAALFDRATGLIGQRDYRAALGVLAEMS